MFRRRSGELTHRTLRHLFLFIGADPNTAWLEGCVDLDAKGFELTRRGDAPVAGARHCRSKRACPACSPSATVRAGSTKRLAAAVGEGAAVVAQIHGFLAP